MILRSHNVTMIGAAVDFYTATLVWGLLWHLVLYLGEGPRAISTQYRINFWHGVVSTAMATLCLLGAVSDSVTVPCSLGYFVTDVCNMLLNDFRYRVASYQGPAARKAEYFHHVLCIVVCVASQMYHRSACHLQSDPVVRIMLAEVSTPFLILFRETKRQLFGVLFLITFLLCRTVYQCLFLMPELFVACPRSIGFSLVCPYILLQLYFTYEVVNRARRGPGDAIKKKT